MSDSKLLRDDFFEREGSAELKKKVAFIFGGQSSEHDVSNITAESVIRNLDKEKYEPVMIGIKKNGTWIKYKGPVSCIGNGTWENGTDGYVLPQNGKIDECVEFIASTNESITDCGDREKTSLMACSGLYDEAGAFTGSGAGSVAGAVTGSGTEAVTGSGTEAVTGAGAGTGTGAGSGGGIAADVVFPLLHGCNGEDGTIQGLLEMAGIPYVGSGVMGSALGMDKAYAKIIFEHAGLPQCKYLVFERKKVLADKEGTAEKIRADIGLPCFIKPSNSGSSVGISKAHDKEEIIKALELASRYDRRIIAEEAVTGKEIECSVLGNDEAEASVPGEVIPSNEFYDYEDKYLKNKSTFNIPAPIPPEAAATIREYSVRAFRALDCSGLARVDFFYCEKTGKILINELNTMPGFTGISMYPKLWQASGIAYPDLITRLIELAFERHKDNKRET
ncbi:MAG: D-alanine--D-alanine ligase [Eubacteriales bacterium]|nr:D-alanine--D-alanine ligase [Eubacteriales bacterium]